MVKIEKKIYPEYFEEVLNGNKTFELRLNDFDINKGDILVLKEWSPEKKEYTGREVEKEVGFVGKWRIQDLKFWSQEEIEEKGIQVISIK